MKNLSYLKVLLKPKFWFDKENKFSHEADNWCKHKLYIEKYYPKLSTLITQKLGPEFYRVDKNVIYFNKAKGVFTVVTLGDTKPGRLTILRFLNYLNKLDIL